MLRDASRSQTWVLENADMTHSVGGSYYCFELRQQAACVATCSFLIAHRLFSDSTVVMWLTGLGRGNVSPFLSSPNPPDQLWGSAILLFNPLTAKLNPISHLLALLGVHHIIHVSRVRVNAWGEQSGWGVKLATHHHQMPRSWISGIFLYFPKMSSSFVATVHFWLCRLPAVHLTLKKP